MTEHTGHEMVPSEVLDDEHGAMEAAALSYARTILKGDDNG